jgi:hypothetical protein
MPAINPDVQRCLEIIRSEPEYPQTPMQELGFWPGVKMTLGIIFRPIHSARALAATSKRVLIKRITDTFETIPAAVPTVQNDDYSKWKSASSAWVICPRCRRIWPKADPRHDCRVPYMDVERARQACASIAQVEYEYWRNSRCSDIPGVEIGGMGAAANIFGALAQGLSLEQYKEQIAHRGAPAGRPPESGHVEPVSELSEGREHCGCPTGGPHGVNCPTVLGDMARAGFGPVYRGDYGCLTDDCPEWGACKCGVPCPIGRKVQRRG